MDGWTRLTGTSATSRRGRAARTRKRAARRTQSASMADVARLAGVSSQTVSRVSNGFPGVDRGDAAAGARRDEGAGLPAQQRRPGPQARRVPHHRRHHLQPVHHGQRAHAGGDRHLGGARGLRRSPCCRSPCRPRTRCAERSPGSANSPSTPSSSSWRSHLLDAATVSLPPHVQVVVVDSDAGDRYTRGRHRPGGRHPRRPCSICWTSATARSGIWPAPRAPSRRSAAPTPGAPSSPRPGGRCRPLRARRLVGGVRLPRRAADSPTSRTARPCSWPTTRWRSGLLRALHEQRPQGARGRQRRSASTTSPRPRSFLPPLTTVHQDFAEVGRPLRGGRAAADAPGRDRTRHDAGADPAGRAGEHGAAAVVRRRGEDCGGDVGVAFGDLGECPSRHAAGRRTESWQARNADVVADGPGDGAGWSERPPDRFGCIARTAPVGRCRTVRAKAA